MVREHPQNPKSLHMLEKALVGERAFYGGWHPMHQGGVCIECNSPSYSLCYSRLVHEHFIQRLQVPI